MNIELTLEQAEAFGRGESITLTPKPKQWEPCSGVYWVMNSGSIFYGSSGHVERMFGTVRHTEEAAKKASAAMRTHNRLLAYVYEFGGDWEADWSDSAQEKGYVYYNYSSRRWSAESGVYRCCGGAVYMSQACAKDLVAKLNSGEVTL